MPSNIPSKEDIAKAWEIAKKLNEAIPDDARREQVYLGISVLMASQFEGNPDPDHLPVVMQEIAENAVSIYLFVREQNSKRTN